MMNVHPDENVRPCLLLAEADDKLLCRLQTAQQSRTAYLPLGSAALAAAYLHHPVPQPDEIERLIQAVEDVLMAHTDWFADWRRPLLVSTEPQDGEIARLAFARAHGSGLLLERDALEQLFNRFSRVVNGKPAVSEGLPVSERFAARLVLLREIMHHWGFTELWLPEAQTSAAF